MDNFSRLHQSLIIILDEVDRICRSNNIQYFLDSGTALGAIRHKGFIPWDDDADIGMLRNDFEMFIKCAEKQLGERFFLHTYYSDNHYLNFNAKIRLNGTFFPDEGSDMYCHHGISVDIFPFDYVPDNRFLHKSLLYFNRQFNRVVRFKDSKPKTTLKRILHKLIAPISLNKFYDSYKRFSIRRKTNTITCYSYRMIEDRELFFPVESMCPSKDVEFEKRKYMIMNNPDTYLTIMYNDYMTRPSDKGKDQHLNGEIRYDI